MVTCSHCGSAMDVTKPGAPELLYKAATGRRTFPIEIGRTGTFEGLPFTVVGRIRYEERDDEGVYPWDELLLHNAQAGYRYLALEEGHWMLFSPARQRPAGLDPRRASPGQSFRCYGETYKVIERSSAVIEHIEGELTWLARRGDRIGYLDAVRPPHMYSVEWTDKEMEHYVGLYLSRESVAAAFGVPPLSLPAPEGVAPAQPLVRSPARKGIVAVSSAAAVLLLVSLVVAGLAGPGRTVFQQTLSSAVYLDPQGVCTEVFDLGPGNHICELRVNAPCRDSWVSLGVSVLDESDEELADEEAECSYYSGVEGGESWSEGSTSDSRLFTVKGPGRFRLRVAGEGGTGETGPAGNEPVTLEVRDGAVPLRYFVWGAILCALVPLWELLRTRRMESRRWQAASDDDDD